MAAAALVRAHPEAWWRTTDAAVRAIAPDICRAARGIGLAGQMHGATLLGASGLSRDQMPRACEGLQVTGRLRDAVADA